MTLLSDRTNAMMRPTGCDVCIAAKQLNVRIRAKVTIDSLQEVVYEELIDTEMNDLDLCIEVV